MEAPPAVGAARGSGEDERDGAERRAAPTAGGASMKAYKPGRAEQMNMTTWGTNASLAVQNAHLQLQDEG